MNDQINLRLLLVKNNNSKVTNKTFCIESTFTTFHIHDIRYDNKYTDPKTYIVAYKFNKRYKFQTLYRYHAQSLLLTINYCTYYYVEFCRHDQAFIMFFLFFFYGLLFCISLTLDKLGLT